MITFLIDVLSGNKEDVATLMHNALKGYKEYKNNNILLNYTDQDEIVLQIGPEKVDKGELNLNSLIHVEYGRKPSMDDVSTIVKNLVYKCMNDKDPVEAFVKTFPKEILENDTREFDALVVFIKEQIESSINLIKEAGVVSHTYGTDSSDYFTYLHAIEDTKLRAKIEILSYLEHVKNAVQIEKICEEDDSDYGSDAETI